MAQSKITCPKLELVLWWSREKACVEPSSVSQRHSHANLRLCQAKTKQRRSYIAKKITWELRSELFPTEDDNTVILKMYHNCSFPLPSEVLLLLLPLFTCFEIQVNTSYNHLFVQSAGKASMGMPVRMARFTPNSLGLPSPAQKSCLGSPDCKTRLQ